MNELLQSHRAHVIHLCHDVIDACSLTDIEVLKIEARGILQDMGVEQSARQKTPHIAPHVTEDWSDLL